MNPEIHYPFEAFKEAEEYAISIIIIIYTIWIFYQVYLTIKEMKKGDE